MVPLCSWLGVGTPTTSSLSSFILQPVAVTKSDAPSPLPTPPPHSCLFFSSDLHFAISTQDRALYFWTWIFLEGFFYLCHQVNSLVSSDGYVIYIEIGAWDFLCLLVLLKTLLVAPLLCCYIWVPGEEGAFSIKMPCIPIRTATSTVIWKNRHNRL